MNNSILMQIGKFITLVFSQVFIFNNINFLGYLNPYIYIIFIVTAPININRSLFLFLSFIIGLTIDVFGDSGGVHAAACLIAAFIRPVLLRSVFGLSYEFQTVKLSKVGLGALIIYVAAVVLIHHTILFSLEIFNTSLLSLIVEKTIFSSIFSILIISLILILFRRKNS